MPLPCKHYELSVRTNVTESMLSQVSIFCFFGMLYAGLLTSCRVYCSTSTVPLSA